MQTWMDAVADVSDDAIVRGLNECIRTGEEWPPSLPAFLKMCGVTRESEFERAQRARMRPTADPALVEHKSLDERKGEGYRGFRELLDKMRLARSERTTLDENDPEVRRKRAEARRLARLACEGERIGRQADEVMP